MLNCLKKESPSRQEISLAFLKYSACTMACTVLFYLWSTGLAPGRLRLPNSKSFFSLGTVVLILAVKQLVWSNALYEKSKEKPEERAEDIWKKQVKLIDNELDSLRVWLPYLTLVFVFAEWLLYHTAYLLLFPMISLLFLQAHLPFLRKMRKL